MKKTMTVVEYPSWMRKRAEFAIRLEGFIVKQIKELDLSAEEVTMVLYLHAAMMEHKPSDVPARKYMEGRK